MTTQEPQHTAPISGLDFTSLTGNDLRDCLPDLARLRMKIFRDFPYLYEGNLTYEENYLRRYAEAPDAVIIFACKGSRVVGASTAIPLEYEDAAFQQPLEAQGFDPRDVFYFGESVLEPAWRGRGAGVAFFRYRESHARALKRFKLAAFCAVIRPDDHPMQPPHYRPLNHFWANRGFRECDGAIARYSWQDRGETVESEKRLQFWVKRL